MTPLRRAFDITDPVIAWRLILASWIAVILLMFPALTLTWRNGGLAPMTAVGAIPLLAHGAVFLAGLRTPSAFRDPARLKLMLPVLTYPAGVLACLTMMPLEMALSMPYVGIIMALLTFGIFFTGLAPLLAIILTNMVLSGGVTPPRLAACLAIYVTGWLMSGLTGYALGHA